jgi:hypothetical protein
LLGASVVDYLAGLNIVFSLHYKKVDDLIPYVNNSRTHSEEQVTQVASSIKEFGFTNPILIDEDCGIIAGHGRLMAAKKLSMDEVPCIELTGLTEAQKKAYVIADNQLALNSGWDLDMLKVEIEGLNELDFNIDLLGFDDEFLDGLMEPVGEGHNEGEHDYSRKIETPEYTPEGDQPDISELIDSRKTTELIDRIEKSGAPEDIKCFLRSAAYRHDRFDFKKIANYYAHAEKEIQELMEDSALVIIDFDDAISKGFVKLSNDIAEQYKNERS